MKCLDRNGNVVKANETQTKILSYLYKTIPGRMVLSVLVKPWVSKCAGILLDQPISTCLIPSFIEHNHIDLSEYETKSYSSYNDFFKRRIKPGYRPIDSKPDHLVAPCDSKLSVYPIDSKQRFCIKNTWYTMSSLFRSKKLAKRYEGGQILIFRLAVDDYHHYCYIDSGIKTKNYRIPGFFHTVNPLANDVYPIYKENTREFSLLKSSHFGQVLMMEVGALIVGKICNLHEEKLVVRGEEKGWFEFGGSTVILCFQKDTVTIDEDILCNSSNGNETIVKQGERIGIHS